MNLDGNHQPFLSIKLPLDTVDNVISQLAKSSLTKQLAVDLLTAKQQLLTGTYGIECRYMGVLDRKFQHPCGGYEETFNSLVKLQGEAADTTTYQIVRVAVDE